MTLQRLQSRLSRLLSRSLATQWQALLRLAATVDMIMATRLSMVTTTAMVTIMITVTTMLTKRILAFALAAVALLSCSKEQLGDPYMLFEVHGKVVDTSGNPIQGINVISAYTDVQVTNINGSFSFYGRSVPSDRVMLTFEDKDGDKNGGEFVKMTKEVYLNEKTPGSKTGNFKGTFFAGDVEIVMLMKESELNPDSGFIPQSE